MGRLEHSVIAVLPETDWSDWDRFVHRAPSGTVYHTGAWLSALAVGMGQAIRVHCIAQEGVIRAGAVVRAGSKFGFSVARKPWATAYNGVVVHDDPNGLFEKEMLCRLSREYHHTRLVYSPGAGAELPRQMGWTVTHQSTPLLDLSDPDTLWASFDRRVRQRTRKATDAGIHVSETDDAGVFYDLYRLTYARQGLPMPLAKEEVVCALTMARDLGAVRIFLAHTRDGDPAAALVVGADTKRGYFMLAGSHPAHRKTDAVTLLWWQVMQEGAKSYRELDLVGHGVDSIDRFKRSFSPRMAEHFDVARYAPGIRGTLLRLEERAKAVPRAFGQGVGRHE